MSNAFGRDVPGSQLDEIKSKLTAYIMEIDQIEQALSQAVDSSNACDEANCERVKPSLIHI